MYGGTVCFLIFVSHFELLLTVPKLSLAPAYGAYGAPPVAVAMNAQHALAMDAADGVIDGRIGGAPIAQAGYGAPMMAHGL